MRKGTINQHSLEFFGICLNVSLLKTHFINDSLVFICHSIFHPATVWKSDKKVHLYVGESSYSSSW